MGNKKMQSLLSNNLINIEKLIIEWHNNLLLQIFAKSISNWFSANQYLSTFVHKKFVDIALSPFPK